MDPKRAERLKQRDFDLVFDGVQMRAIEREDSDGVKRKYLVGTASSTAQDLYGSIIKPEAQAQMLAKLTSLAVKMADKKSGLTAWLNHSYKIPEDTFGAFTGSALTQREENGEKFIDLDIECRVIESNPRAMAAYEQVKDGIRHGWSIGAYFRQIEWMSDDPDDPNYWNYYVTYIDLLEISLVGIPANQRAWCRSTDDLKARAVATAERIASEGRGATPQERRELVQRSLIAHEDVSPSVDDEQGMRSARQALAAMLAAPAEAREGKIADSTSTSPITARAEDVENPTATGSQSSESTDGATQGTAAAPPVAEVSDKRDLITEEALRSIGREAAVKTLRALQDEVGDRDGNGIRYALEIGIRAIEREAQAPEEKVLNAVREALQTHLKATELAAFIRNPVKRENGDEVPLGHEAREKIADAIDLLHAVATAKLGILVNRDPEGGDGVGEMREQIAGAIGHIASAVAHGLCMESSSHLSEAMLCLSVAVGTEVEQPGPEGTQASAEVTATLAEAQRNLAETSTTLESKRAELTALDATLTERKTELATIEKRIKEDGAKRLGRRPEQSLNAALAARAGAASEERPELSPVEAREALRAMLAGDGSLSARDQAAKLGSA